MFRFLLLCICLGAVWSDWKTVNRLMEDPNLFEGDIQLDPDEKIEGKNGYASIIGGRWPGAKVPYVITRYIGSGGRQVIMDAIKAYHDNTCLRFVPRTNERAYISFGGGNGCSSPVGYRRGRVNHITLPGGCQNKGTAMHEMGHSIGLYHEQSRPDRDEFVDIVWGNIQGGMDYNFNKYGHDTINSLGTPYDYGSMMHYQSGAFSRNGYATIRAKKANAQRYLGNRRGFSQIDIKQINLMYCKGVIPTLEPPTPLPTQPPGGCLDFDERCKGWANGGYCQSDNKKYKEIMDRKCCLSCKGGIVPTGGPKTLPPTECKNIDNRCEFWASNGYCPQSNCVEPDFVRIMNQKCCLACKNGARCHNRNERCQEWAERGECDANPKYMNDFCRQACKRCR